jgi:hypothetical protein
MRLEKTLTVDEIVARLEELGREFTASGGDIQLGFEILGEFFLLNSHWAFLIKNGL